MKNKKSYAIPILPTHSIEATLAFYQALGFEVTYQQKKPNTFAAIKRGDIELQFFVMKNFDPKNNYSTCYLIVFDIDDMYTSFVSGIKNLFGKALIKGIPRINPLKDIPSYGVRQFIVVDPSGNYIRIGQPIEKVDSMVYDDNNKSGLLKEGSPNEVAYELAGRLADGKGDLEAAAKVLDKALRSNDEGDQKQVLKMFLLRADIALRMTDLATTDQYISRIEEVLDKGFLLEDVQDDLRLFEELKELRREV